MPDFSSAIWNKPAAAAAADYTVENSCRFWGAGAVGLNRTFGTPTNQGIWTFSGWWKNIHESGNWSGGLFLQASNGAANADVPSYPDFAVRLLPADEFYIHNYTGSAYSLLLTSNEKFRDPSAWYHVVYSYEYNVGSGDTFKMWVNNKRVTWRVNDAGFPSGIGSLQVNHDPDGAENHAIGMYGYNQQNQTNSASQLADVHFIDGQAKIPSDFAEEDDNGQWVPKEYTGDDYGNNGFHLDFSDSSDLGADAAGSNDFTAAGLLLGSHDQTIDTPSAGKNFCTFNPLQFGTAQSGSAHLYEGNLTAEITSSDSGNRGHYQPTTFYLTSGKWYAEFRLSSGGEIVGVIPQGAPLDTYYLAYGAGAGVGMLCAGTNCKIFNYDNGGNISGSSHGTVTANDIIAITLDLDDTDGVAKFYTFGGSGFANSGLILNSGFDLKSAASEWAFCIGNDATGGWTVQSNFGQDPTFCGTESPSTTYTDEGGVGSFMHEPPAGFLAVCTANLDAPGLNNAVDDEKAFSTKIYTGDDGSSETGVGFQPDLTWIKNRDAGYSYIIGDSVRGGDGSAMYFMASNGTGAEDADADKLVSLDSDGFTVGEHAGAGDDGVDYVAWNWKAGTTGERENGDIHTTSGHNYTESHNADAGFSIVKYDSGSGSNFDDSSNPYDDLAHSLGSPVELGIFKMRNPDDGVGGTSQSWCVFHKDLADGHNLVLDGTSGETNGYNFVAESEVTVSEAVVNGPNHISLYYGSNMNTSTQGIAVNRENGQGASGQFIAYLFRSVEGYSKVGSYTGNGVADGPFVYCGFRPAYVWIKKVDTSTPEEAWYVQDTARDTNNEAVEYLQLESGAAKFTGDGKDLLSNGFKIRNTYPGQNDTGGTTTYIYYAVAENPFKFANAR